MTGTGYAIVAYIVGSALLWGYAVSILLASRAARRAGHSGNETP